MGLEAGRYESEHSFMEAITIGSNILMAAGTTVAGVAMVGFLTAQAPADCQPSIISAQCDTQPTSQQEKDILISAMIGGVTVALAGLSLRISVEAGSKRWLVKAEKKHYDTEFDAIIASLSKQID